MTGPPTILAAGDAVARPVGAEAHVWRVRLDRSPALVAELAGSLSRDERARAARFRFARHRSRFVVGRAALRQVLGSYLGRPATRVRFRYGERGKPRLAGPGEDLQFNLSHCRDHALIVACADRPVGGDIELLRDVPDADVIARRFFNEAEAAWIRSCEGEQKSRSFLRLWTRKEAYIKAVGGGLSIPLDRVDVLRGRGGSGPVQFADAVEGRGRRWRFTDIDLWPAALAAIATAGRPPRVRILDWSPAGAAAGPGPRAGAHGARPGEHREVQR